MQIPSCFIALIFSYMLRTQSRWILIFSCHSYWVIFINELLVWIFMAVSCLLICQNLSMQPILLFSLAVSSSSYTRWDRHVPCCLPSGRGVCSLWSFLPSTWVLHWYSPHILSCAVSVVPNHMSSICGLCCFSESWHSLPWSPQYSPLTIRNVLFPHLTF